MSALIRGSRLRTTGGKTHTIQSHLGTGSQADVYVLDDGKLVFKRFRSEEEMPRVRWLHKQRLPTDLPMALPLDVVDEGGHCGYIARLAQGSTLAELLASTDFSYADSVAIAHGIMDALARIHGHMAHGDVREENIFVAFHRGAAGELLLDGVVFIDPDNYSAPGAPQPLYLGDNLVMAPELRHSRDPAHVSCAADVYAAAQIAHLLLLRHSDTAFAATGPEFQAAMLAGRWHSDRFSSQRRDTGLHGEGFAAEMLDTRLASLFRAALQAKPELRPHAADFALHLGDLLNHGRIIHCPHCNWPMVLEPGITHCAHTHRCGKAFDAPKVLLPDGRRLALEQPLVLGRDQLGHERISRRHVLLQRAGPLVYVRDLAPANGTEVRFEPGKDWSKLPARADAYLSPHPSMPMLRLAGVSVKLVF